MTRRLLGPIGGPILFLLVAGLVFAGLGWVTVAALRVEAAQREAALQASRDKDLRLALWQLDARMLPALGVEDTRPFHEYKTYSPADPITQYGPACAPLLAADIPDWMRLHFQVDADAGWGSPQVLAEETAAALRGDWPNLSLRNATPERASFLDSIRTRYPARRVCEVFAARERAVPPGSPPLVAPFFVDGGIVAPTEPSPGGAAPRAPPVPAPSPPPPVAAPTGLPPVVAPPGARPATEALGRRDRAENDKEEPDGTVRRKASESAGLPLREAEQQAPVQPAPQPRPSAPDLYAGKPPAQSGDYSPRQNTIGKAADEAQKLANRKYMPQFPGFGFGFAGGGVGQGVAPARGQTANGRQAAPGPGMPFTPPTTPGGLAGGFGGAGLPGGSSALGATASPSPAPTAPPAGPAGPPVALSATGGMPAGSSPPLERSAKGPAAAGVAPACDTIRDKVPDPKAGAAAKKAQDAKLKDGPASGALSFRSAMPAPAKPGEPTYEFKKKHTEGRGLTKLIEDFTQSEPGRLHPTADDAMKRGGLEKEKKGLAAFGAKSNEDAKSSPPTPPGSAMAKAAAATPPGGGPGGPAALGGAGAAGRPPAPVLSAPLAALPPVAGRDEAGKPEPQAVPPTPDPMRPAELERVPPPMPPAAAENGAAILAGAVDTLPPVAVHLGSMRPQWITAADGTELLVLVRAARLENKKTVYQGVVLDWPKLKAVLKEEVKDLFPEAKLVPVKDPAAVSRERAMTALPVQLDPGTDPVPPPARWTPLRVGLVLAWAAALIAFAAVGLCGWSLIDLAERRIRFVSAVTHELRTPLTSLRLYLDLLLSGMVQDEEKRKEYLCTLNMESDRLHRLIDNVLDFARLERRRKGQDVRPVRLADLLEHVRRTWTDRCGADGKELVVISTVPPEQEVCTDPSLVEQIVGNLIDNARKYTREAGDTRIWLWAKPDGPRRVVLEVEDRGPGVPPGEQKLIFRPFRRGESADTKAGGAGLGLALSKRWAEVLGGKLTYRPAEGGVGSCFRLELPVK